MRTYTLSETAKLLILVNNTSRSNNDTLTFEEKNMSDNEFFVYVMDLIS